MKELIERLERASGSSFELNAEIARLDFYREQHGDMADDEVPDFCASIDAALTLVPELCWARVQTETRDALPIAWATNETNEHSFEGQGATPALALCIASLRARAALSGVGRLR